jgi:threonine/homoserine/homoserine lactone efflux protein
MRFAITDIAFLRGLIAGIALAAPLGPVAILCIRRGLVRGRIECFVAGLGAALADTVFGAVAGLGITFVSSLVMEYETVIGTLGGLILVAVGALTFRTPVCHITGAVQVQSLRRDVATAFTMAITNPATMLGAAGIFAVFGPIDLKTEPFKAFWLVAGLFAGSAGWWLVLGLAVGTFHEKFVDGGLARLNKLSGAVIGVSGALVLAVVAYRSIAA